MKNTQEQDGCIHCQNPDGGKNWDMTKQFWYCDDCYKDYIEYLENEAWLKT